MSDGWKVLLDAGVPFGAIRPAPARLQSAVVRAAAKQLLPSVEKLDRRERDALYAWLRGFHRHWPKQFKRVLGSDGAKLLAKLEQDPPDPNRYLKLKRIAVENLAAVVLVEDLEALEALEDKLDVVRAQLAEKRAAKKKQKPVAWSAARKKLDL